MMTNFTYHSLCLNGAELQSKLPVGTWIWFVGKACRSRDWATHFEFDMISASTARAARVTSQIGTLPFPLPRTSLKPHTPRPCQPTAFTHFPRVKSKKKKKDPSRLHTRPHAPSLEGSYPPVSSSSSSSSAGAPEQPSLPHTSKNSASPGDCFRFAVDRVDIWNPRQTVGSVAWALWWRCRADIWGEKMWLLWRWGLDKVN